MHVSQDPDRLFPSCLKSGLSSVQVYHVGIAVGEDKSHSRASEEETHDDGWIGGMCTEDDVARGLKTSTDNERFAASYSDM
jgi:hypothetical protein